MKALVADNFFVNNVASEGGGIYLFVPGQTTITGNIFKDNKAKGYEIQGQFEHGGEGGGIFVEPGEKVIINNNTFHHNYAKDHWQAKGKGSGIAWAGYPAGEIKNNIIAENFGPYGLYCYNSYASCSNNDVWNNEVADYGGACGPSPGDISQNPLFLEDSTYTISKDSPCIDAGTDVGLPFYGKAPDMGAQEFYPYSVRKARIMKYWEMLKIPVDDIKEIMKKE
jgi:hypothetical protein